MKTTRRSISSRTLLLTAALCSQLLLLQISSLTAQPATERPVGTAGAAPEVVAPESPGNTGKGMNADTLPETELEGLTAAAEALAEAENATAAELARAYLEKHPDSIDARLIIAKSLDPFFNRRDRMNLYLEAYELAEKVGARQEQKAMIVLELGLIYEYLEQFEDSEQYLKEAAENYELYDQDTNARVYSGLGHLFLRTGREEEGILALKTAAEKFDSETARQRLQLMEYQGFFRESREKAAADDP